MHRVRHIIEYIEGKFITFDKCFICGWKGLSEDVKDDNKCPRCGSKDMDDIDANPYEDD
jgi:predicted Zn-ribbon and HTH transcriptional regulator